MQWLILPALLFTVTLSHRTELKILQMTSCSPFWLFSNIFRGSHSSSRAGLRLLLVEDACQITRGKPRDDRPRTSSYQNNLLHKSCYQNDPPTKIMALPWEILFCKIQSTQANAKIIFLNLLIDVYWRQVKNETAVAISYAKPLSSLSIWTWRWKLIDWALIWAKVSKVWPMNEPSWSYWLKNSRSDAMKICEFFSC